MDTSFPSLSVPMQEAGQKARDLGLWLMQFNSGATQNPINGFRIFNRWPRDGFFHGGHIIHLKTKAEVNAFLAGFSAAHRSQENDTLTKPQ